MEIPGSSAISRGEPLAQLVEARVPEVTVPVEPLGRVPERRAVELGGPELRVACPRNESGPLEDLDVLRHRLDRDRERLGELVHGGLALGEGGEGECELVGGHVPIKVTAL